MVQRAVGIFQGQGVGLAVFGGGPHLLEQEAVAAGLDADDEAHVVIVQIGEVRSVGAQGVLDDDDGQFRMFLAKACQETA